jgi:hypothetical protein
MEEFERNGSVFSNRDAYTEQVQQFSREAFKTRINRIVEERIRV